MALFGKSDANGVSILTAFYQADADESKLIGGELDTLLYRYIYNEPHSLRLWSETRDELNPVVESAIFDLAKNHRLLVRLMGVAADKKFADDAFAGMMPHNMRQMTHDELSLNRLIEQVLRPPLIRWVHDGIPNGFFTVWYKDNPIGGKQDTPREDTQLFLSWLLSNFVKAVEREAFTRCEECNSAFAASRGNVRFCSRRCAARAGERKRRVIREELHGIAIK